MFSWRKITDQQRKIRNDRKFLEARARRFLKSYLLADEAQKHRYYQAVEGASAACRPPIQGFDDALRAETTSEAALIVVRHRTRQARDDQGKLALFITDAYATVAVAYRRAAGVYAVDKEMLQLGTAAVHLLTMATSYMTANPPE